MQTPLLLAIKLTLYSNKSNIINDVILIVSYFNVKVNDHIKLNNNKKYIIINNLNNYFIF